MAVTLKSFEELVQGDASPSQGIDLEAADPLNWIFSVGRVFGKQLGCGRPMQGRPRDRRGRLDYKTVTIGNAARISLSRDEKKRRPSYVPHERFMPSGLDCYASKSRGTNFAAPSAVVHGAYNKAEAS